MNLLWIRVLSALPGILVCLGLLAYFMQTSAMQPIDYYDLASMLPFGVAFCLWLSTRCGRHQPVSSLKQFLNRTVWLMLALSLCMAFAELDNLSSLGAALALLLLVPLYHLVLQLLLEPLQHRELTPATVKALQAQWPSELGVHTVSACLALAMMLFVVQYTVPASSETTATIESLMNDPDIFSESEVKAE